MKKIRIETLIDCIQECEVEMDAIDMSCYKHMQDEKTRIQVSNQLKNDIKSCLEIFYDKIQDIDVDIYATIIEE